MPLFLVALLAAAAGFYFTRKPSKKSITTGNGTASPSASASAPKTIEGLITVCEALAKEGKTDEEIRAVMNGKGIGGQNLDLAIEIARYRANRDKV